MVDSAEVIRKSTDAIRGTAIIERSNIFLSLPKTVLVLLLAKVVTVVGIITGTTVTTDVVGTGIDLGHQKVDIGREREATSRSATIENWSHLEW